MNLNNSISNIKNNYFLYLYNKKKSLIKYKKKILNFYIYKFLNIIPNFDALKIKLDEKFDKDPNLLNFYQKFLYLKAYNN